MNENVNVRNRKAVVGVFKIFQQNSRISYLANSASAETLIGMLAMTSPPSPSLGSITWHFRMGCSLMWTSLLDLNDTVTGWGRSFMFRVILLGFTVNKSQGLGFLGSQLSKTKLQIFSGCYSSTILLTSRYVHKCCDLKMYLQINLSKETRFTYLYWISNLPLFFRWQVSFSSCPTLTVPKSSPPSFPENQG